MKKKAIYFPISTTHYHSTLSLNIIRTKGWAGYGQYLAIMQMLANTPERKLSIESIPEIAFNLHITDEEAKTIIDAYYSLDDDGNFYSPELNEGLSFFDDKYNKASSAGKKSAKNLSPEERKERATKAANARWNKDNNANANHANTLASNANEMLTPKHNANNKIKENKIEKNENTTEENGQLAQSANAPILASSNNDLNNNLSTKSEDYNHKKEVIENNSLQFLIDKTDFGSLAKSLKIDEYEKDLKSSDDNYLAYTVVNNYINRNDVNFKSDVQGQLAAIYKFMCKFSINPESNTPIENNTLGRELLFNLREKNLSYNDIF